MQGERGRGGKVAVRCPPGVIGQRRAQAVVRYLGGHGVKASNLVAKGYGQSKPIAADPLSGDNRRVETRLRTE